MSKPFLQRLEPDYDDGVVVFAVGFRINRFWNLRHVYYTYRSFYKITRELKKSPETGCLGVNTWWGLSTVSIQYWKSYDALLEFARDKQATHFPSWFGFNQGMARSGNIGLWHEIYVVPKGRIEATYRNIQLGLGHAVGFTNDKGPRINRDDLH